MLGHSQGGTFLPRIGERDPQIAGLIMLAGLARPFDVALQAQLDYLVSLDPKSPVEPLLKLADTLQKIREDGTEPLEAFNGDEVQANYWASMLTYDPLDTVKALHMPMLILQGERDYQVTMEDLVLWQKTLVGHDDVTFKSYPTLTHLFMALGDLKRLSTPSDYNEAGFVDQEVITDIARWIQAH